MNQFSFSKKNRLLKSFDFNRVFYKHYRVNSKIIGILGSSNKEGYPRLGCSISRKKISFSNKRNTLKRIIRESFRLCKHKLFSMDFVVVINKKDIYKQNNLSIKKNIQRLWIRYYR